MSWPRKGASSPSVGKLPPSPQKAGVLFGDPIGGRSRRCLGRATARPLHRSENFLLLPKKQACFLGTPSGVVPEDVLAAQGRVLSIGRKTSSFPRATGMSCGGPVGGVLCRGVAQSVARLVRDQEAGCSSHLTPTNAGAKFALLRRFFMSAVRKTCLFGSPCHGLAPSIGQKRQLQPSAAMLGPRGAARKEAPHCSASQRYILFTRTGRGSLPPAR